MTPRHLLMTAALLMAGALLAFGDRTPSSDVAEAVARTPVAVTKPAASGTTATATGPLIVALQPRGALLMADVQAGSGAETGLFAHTDWTPLHDRARLFPEDLDLTCPWQFQNVLV